MGRHPLVLAHAVAELPMAMAIWRTAPYGKAGEASVWHDVGEDSVVRVFSHNDGDGGGKRSRLEMETTARRGKASWARRHEW